jgi:hypothetical protein
MWELNRQQAVIASVKQGYHDVWLQEESDKQDETEEADLLLWVEHPWSL